MPAESALILGAIVIVFVTFAIGLAYADLHSSRTG
jgi:hypothetical protein